MYEIEVIFIDTFILTILFGWTGYYRFKNNQPIWGIVYLCTLGLFCFGWIYDIYCAGKDIASNRNVINSTKANNSTILIKVPPPSKWSKTSNKISDLQRVLSPETTDFALPDSVLQNDLKYRLESDLRQIKDCVEIIKNTSDRNVFYSRFRLLEEAASELKMISPFVKENVQTSLYAASELIMNKEALTSEFETYIANVENIESMWSVISNLKLFNGEQAKTLENACINGIVKHQNNIEMMKNRYSDYFPPKYVPAYIRLAMLYEKQAEYEKAINVCVQAIKIGAYDDHSKGKMYGRLARMIKKSGIEVNDEIKRLAEITP